MTIVVGPVAGRQIGLLVLCPLTLVLALRKLLITPVGSKQELGDVRVEVEASTVVGAMTFHAGRE